MRTYHWKHIPSGHEGVKEFSEELIPADSTNAWLRVQALELVNKWNRSSNGVWLYWLEG